MCCNQKLIFLQLFTVIINWNGRLNLHSVFLWKLGFTVTYYVAIQPKMSIGLHENIAPFCSISCFTTLISHSESLQVDFLILKPASSWSFYFSCAKQYSKENVFGYSTALLISCHMAKSLCCSGLNKPHNIATWVLPLV